MPSDKIFRILVAEEVEQLKSRICELHAELEEKGKVSEQLFLIFEYLKNRRYIMCVSIAENIAPFREIGNVGKRNYRSKRKCRGTQGKSC